MSNNNQLTTSKLDDMTNPELVDFMCFLQFFLENHNDSNMFPRDPTTTTAQYENGISQAKKDIKEIKSLLKTRGYATMFDLRAQQGQET